MLQVSRSVWTQIRAPIGRQVRRHGHTAYGPAEPSGLYIRWTAAVAITVGLVTYDRYYSDRAISRWITPKDRTEEFQAQVDRVNDFQKRDRDRAITLFAPANRSASHENFGPRPVPAGSYRAAHTNAVLDTDKLGERRGRTKALSDES